MAVVVVVMNFGVVVSGNLQIITISSADNDGAHLCLLAGVAFGFKHALFFPERRASSGQCICPISRHTFFCVKPSPELVKAARRAGVVV